MTRTILFLLLSNVLFAQVQNPQFEVWDLYNGREKPAEWFCPNLCPAPECGPCDKITEGPADYAVRIHNVMPCVSPDNQSKSRSPGFIRDFFIPPDFKFKISFDLIIDSIDAPAEFIFTIDDYVWTTNQIQSQRIEHEIILSDSYDSILIQFEARGYLKQNALHDCDLGYISAIVDNIQTDDLIRVQDIGKHTIQLYPNPFNDVLHIGVESASVAWKLYNLTGQLIMSGNSNEINCPNKLSEGLYLIQIMQGTNIYFEKVIKE